MFERVARIVCLFLLTLSAAAWPQGTGVQFLNFEAPAHQPIAVVEVDGDDYLLVANGPDNSVEVWTTAAQPRFLLRVPTGQRPITVAVRPTPTSDDGRLVYTANWLGDSITLFELAPTGNPGAPLSFRWVRTETVGDEPVGLTFLPENPGDLNSLPGGALHELLLVTFSAPAVWGAFDPDGLTAVAAPLELLVNGAGSTTFAVRDPRAIAFAPPPAGPGAYDDQFWILNFRGGNTSVYDLDLWGSDDLINAAATETANLPAHGGFGTTNYNMEFAANGDLWVVGILCRNQELQDFIFDLGEPVFQGMVLNETGFATSFLARHRDLTNPLAVPQILDLNDANQGAGPKTQAPQAVTNPTDVAVYGSGEDNTEAAPDQTIVFATGFSSDTLAAVRPTSGPMSGWTVDRIDLNATATAFSRTNLAGVMRGPRALALQASGVANDPNDRLYVYNRLENSVTVVDPNYATPATAVGTTFSLQGQVEPAHVTAGRKFLYSSKLSRRTPMIPSGADGNVSCSTCHIDGNTDFLAWNLADGGAIPPPGDPLALPGALGPNADRKGPMVTQPLRGLVNFEVAEDAVQDLAYSNRPYHWRGDKGLFEHFNAAFVNLLGAANLTMGPASPAFHTGIPGPQMTLYRRFTFSIHYPPNPLQPWQRVYSGSMFDGEPPVDPFQQFLQLNNATLGSGAQLGLKAFHVVNSDGAACVHCHALPDGSNNRLTEPLGNSQSSQLPVQNLETAQLKGLVLKEKRLIRSSFVNGVINFQEVPSTGNAAVTHEFGLIHTGESTIGALGSNSINDFVSGFGPLNVVNPILEDAVSLYMREFDTGTAPLVGFTSSLDVAEYSAAPATYQTALAELEQQRLLAHAGVAVHARIDGVLRGFWYDTTDSTTPTATPYHEEPQPGLTTIGPFTSVGLLELLNSAQGVDLDNLLTFHFTPLGSSRRVARIQGGRAPAVATTPPSDNVSLLPCPAMVANAEVPRMILNWADLVAAKAFFAALSPPFDASPAASVALYQLSLDNHAPNGYGLDQLRHEVPRRFRVEGDGIEDGALLLLFAPVAADIASGQPPITTPTFATNPIRFVLPLYAGRDSQNNLVWETAAELDPLLLLSLINGAPASAAAVTAFVDPGNGIFFDVQGNYTLLTQDLMQPTLNNWHFVQVANRTSTGFVTNTGKWQRLTLE